MSKWERYFMDVALRTAQLSYCTRLQVGAVAVRDKRVICIGFNGTPPNTPNCCELEDGTTAPNVLHAEDNLARFAEKHNICLEECDLYVTHAPCINCAKIIHASKFDKVYFNQYYRDLSGLNYLQTNKVTIVNADDKAPSTPIK